MEKRYSEIPAFFGSNLLSKKYFIQSKTVLLDIHITDIFLINTLLKRVFNFGNQKHIFTITGIELINLVCLIKVSPSILD